MTVLGLGEYLGLGADDPRSFHADLDRELAGIPIGRREALDGAAADPTPKPRATRPSSTRRRSTSPYSGSGATAHVAFNEPGSRPGDGVRRVALDPSTIAAAAADFGGAARVPREALTTGLRTLRAARELLLIVTGPRPSRWRASGHWPMCRSCSRSRAARPPRTPRGRCPRRGHPRQRRDLAVARARPVLLAPYRAFGLDVDSRPARPLRGWAHLLAEELGGVAGMPRQRRAAMDAVRLPEGL